MSISELFIPMYKNSISGSFSKYAIFTEAEILNWHERNSVHCKKNVRDSWIFFDQTFLGLGLGKLFQARESLVSDILAGDRNVAEPFFTVYVKLVTIFSLFSLILFPLYLYLLSLVTLSSILSCQPDLLFPSFLFSPFVYIFLHQQFLNFPHATHYLLIFVLSSFPFS